MNTKLFSVRSVVSEAFSTVFSVAALPLIFALGLMNFFSESIQLLDLQTVLTTKTTLQDFVDTFGLILIIGFLLGVISIILLLSALYGCISTRISLLIIDKKSITWSNIMPSTIILMRFVCKLLLFLLIIILVLSLSGILAGTSGYFSVFIQSILIFISIVVFIVGLFSLIRLTLTSYFIVENVDVIDSFKKSWNITKGYTLKLFGILICIIFADAVIGIITRIFFMILPGFMLLPVLLRIIIMSLTSAINYLAFARVYRILTHSSATHSVVE